MQHCGNHAFCAAHVDFVSYIACQLDHLWRLNQSYFAASRMPRRQECWEAWKNSLVCQYAGSLPAFGFWRSLRPARPPRLKQDLAVEKKKCKKKKICPSRCYAPLCSRSYLRKPRRASPRRAPLRPARPGTAASSFPASRGPRKLRVRQLQSSASERRTAARQGVLQLHTPSPEVRATPRRATASCLEVRARSTHLCASP